MVRQFCLGGGKFQTQEFGITSDSIGPGSRRLMSSGCVTIVVYSFDPRSSPGFTCALRICNTSEDSFHARIVSQARRCCWPLRPKYGCFYAAVRYYTTHLGPVPTTCKVSYRFHPLETTSARLFNDSAYCIYAAVCFAGRGPRPRENALSSEESWDFDLANRGAFIHIKH